MQEKNKSSKPKKPEVKTQAMPLVEYVDRISRLYGSSDEYGNVESATDRIRDPKKAPVKKAPRMSATRSWQIIKESMSKDELEDHYKRHPEDRPIKVTPYKLDEGLTQMLGDDWLEGGK
jgi:hypothetical protein